MSDNDIGVLKMLFEEHHRQLAEKRQKIHSVTEKAIAIFLIIAGWLIFKRDPLTPGVRWIIIMVAIVLAIGACRSIYANNRSYYDIAGVIRRLNQALDLHEEGRFVARKKLYPDGWKDFGKRGKLKGALFHILAVLVAAALCVFGAFMRT